MPKTSRFHDAETAEDFARALDFLGAYLSPADRRDFILALRDRFLIEWERGYDDGYVDASHEDSPVG